MPRPFDHNLWAFVGYFRKIRTINFLQKVKNGPDDKFGGVIHMDNEKITKNSKLLSSLTVKNGIFNCPFFSNFFYSYGPLSRLSYASSKHGRGLKLQL